ncbi:MAG: septum formation inhibitor Maf [Chloroflexi bacterium]|nr:septum formation inhibitor Maf [Chloroflexota bacterium]
MKKIVLASASPRRKELLEQIGLQFVIESSNHDEQVNPDLSPHELAKSLSLEKAQVVAKNHTDAIIIAADTFIVLGDKILGKPGTDSEAREMLTILNGKDHLVITGFTILDTDATKVVTDSVETTVHMRDMSREDIEAYIATKESIGKAGAYAIQGLGGVIVERIEGDYSNVVGLPLNAVADSLKEFGVRVLS